MQYFNLKLSVLRSPEFVGSEPTQRATWLSLIGWCCDVENDGIIKDCKSWGNRRWMQSCGVLLDEIKDNCSLWQWDGDDLIVSFYPSKSQSEVIARREVARENGRLGGRPKKPTLVSEIEKEKPTLVLKKKAKDKIRQDKIIIKENNLTVIKEKKSTARDFAKLPIDDISAVMTEAKPDLDADYTQSQAQAFKDYFDANGWRQAGNKPIKDWKAAARGWIRRSSSFKGTQNGFKNSVRCNYPQSASKSHIRKDTDDLGALFGE